MSHTARRYWGERSCSWIRCWVIWKGIGPEVQHEFSRLPLKRGLIGWTNAYQYRLATDKGSEMCPTFCRTIEAHVKLLHIVVNEGNLVIWHHPEENGLVDTQEQADTVGEPLHLHNVRFYATPAGIRVNNEKRSVEVNWWWAIKLIMMSRRRKV